MNLKEDAGAAPQILHLMRNNPVLKHEVNRFTLHEWQILSNIGLLKIVQEQPNDALPYIVSLDLSRTAPGTMYNGSNFEEAMTYFFGVFTGTVEEIPVAIPEDAYLAAEQQMVTKKNALNNITFALCKWLNVRTLPSNLQMLLS